MTQGFAPPIEWDLETIRKGLHREVFRNYFRGDIDKALEVLDGKRDTSSVDGALNILYRVRESIDDMFGSEPVRTDDGSQFVGKSLYDLYEFGLSLSAEMHILFAQTAYGLNSDLAHDEVSRTELGEEWVIPLTERANIYEAIRNLEQVRTKGVESLASQTLDRTRQLLSQYRNVVQSHNLPRLDMAEEMKEGMYGDRLRKKFGEEKFEDLFRTDIMDAISVLEGNGKPSELEGAIRLISLIEDNYDRTWGKEPRRTSDGSPYFETEVLKSIPDEEFEEHSKTLNKAGLVMTVAFQMTYEMPNYGLGSESIKIPSFKPSHTAQIEIAQLYETARNLRQARDFGVESLSTMAIDRTKERLTQYLGIIDGFFIDTEDDNKQLRELIYNR